MNLAMNRLGYMLRDYCVQYGMSVKTKVSRFREVIWMVPTAILVMVIPLNIVYHFNSTFAYVDGYFVNYLDFVVHIIDIAVVVILLWAIAFQKVYQHKRFLIVFGLVVLMCGVHCLIFWDWVVVYFAVRLSMYVVAGVALYMVGGKIFQNVQGAKTVRIRCGSRVVLLVLLLSAVVQSIIALLQFSLNHSLGLKVLGESIVQVGAFNASSVYLPGGFHLRGYGTFPHPNILGGFLVISFSLIFNEVVMVAASMKMNVGQEKNQKKNQKKKRGLYKYMLILGLMMILAGIFVTWSRVAWILAVFQGVFWIGLLLKRTGKNIKVYGLIVMFLLVLSLMWILLSNASTDKNLGAAVRERLITQSRSGDVSVSERRELQVRAVEIMGKSPIIGTGMGRFISALAEDPVYTESGIRLMQPAHNVFLLIFSEVGLIGVVSIAGFGLLLLCKEMRQVKSPLLFSLIVTLVFAGIFDHYLWSLPQGLAVWTLLPAVFLRIASSIVPRIEPRIASHTSQ